MDVILLETRIEGAVWVRAVLVRADTAGIGEQVEGIRVLIWHHPDQSVRCEAVEAQEGFVILMHRDKMEIARTSYDKSPLAGSHSLRARLANVAGEVHVEDVSAIAVKLAGSPQVRRRVLDRVPCLLVELFHQLMERLIRRIAQPTHKGVFRAAQFQLLYSSSQPREALHVRMMGGAAKGFDSQWLEGSEQCRAEKGCRDHPVSCFLRRIP
mmetsp:Transcript_27264/g.61887  ORF Transcript_27264/g.61887 Transcript_27264/m.61887 type:complete len:211 (-) Transcript_27264:3-635(-)